MFRNENDLLKSLRNAVNRYDWFNTNTPKDEKITPLTKKELQELEDYRDTDGLLNFTKIKDMDLLSRLVNNVERKNALEENKLADDCCMKHDYSQDYIDSLVYELLPLIGLREANVTVDTPSCKAKINVKQGEKPTVVYETPKEPCNDATLTYSVTDDDNVTTGLGVMTNEGPVCSEAPKCDNEVIDLELADEVDDRVVKLFECGFPHNPQYYHAVKHICELEHFPYCGVYGRDDYDAPENIDVAVLLPNVWGKIAGCDVECFMSMIEEDGIEVYVLNPEDYAMTKIESPFDLLEYEMTPQQEGVMFRHE